MSIRQLQSRVGPDGVLVLSVPVGAELANQEVHITIDASPPVVAKPKMTHEQWVEWVRQTAGSIDDPTFIRHEQGEYEKRDELLP
jgi:hypothetical protein